MPDPTSLSVVLSMQTIMNTSNINAISEEETRRCLPHEEELVVSTVTPLVLFTLRYVYVLTTTAEESKRYNYSNNVVLPQNQHRVNEEAGDTKDEKEAIERQFKAKARSDEECQTTEGNKQNAQKSEPRELGQRKSTTEQKKTNKCETRADNNLAEVSREDREVQKGQRETLLYLDEIPTQSEEGGENTKQRKAESSKGTPCYRSFLALLGTRALQ